MFHGSMPAPMCSIVYEHAGGWPADQDIYIGCSGNFTMERVLHARFGQDRAIHGNDIQAYSCALGWWLSGQPLPFTLRPEYEEDLGWLRPSLDDPTDLLATLMLGTRFLQYVGKSGAYYERMLDATRDQWPRMHDKTATKLRGLTVRLAGFYAGDVRDYLAHQVPPDAPVVMFPPFYCLAPEHRLLTADLRWVPCGELKAGDRLLAFDGKAPEGYRHRRWRWSEIVRSEPAVKECVRVVLEDGTEVICTEDHSWLADRLDRTSRTPRRWVRADRLLEDAPYVIRMLDTWQEARTYEAGWLAGIFDGEGSIHVGSAPKLAIAQRPGIVADQVHELLEEFGFETTTSSKASSVLGIQVAGGIPEAFRALGVLRPERLIARLQQLDITRLSIRSRGNPRVKVVAVESVGPRPIQSIMTTTGTYVGEGFAMHNSGDYESQFAPIDKVFDWPAPSFQELDEDGKGQIIAQVQDRPHWILGLHIERPDLRPYLAGVVQTANRGLPIYVYAAAGPRRIVRPRQPTEPIRMPKIGPDDELGDTMKLHVLTGGQFAAIRSQFMSKSIKPGSPLLACGVSVDGLLVGAFAYLPPKFDPATAYLMSDFPVSWTRYRRLAKLIVMAAISAEAQLLVQRSLSKRIDSWSTTAFTDRPNSSKYGRGIPGARLEKRTEPGGDGIHAYQLQYGGPIGRHDLAETLTLWKRKHGKDQR